MSDDTKTAIFQLGIIRDTKTAIFQLGIIRDCVMMSRQALMAIRDNPHLTIDAAREIARQACADISDRAGSVEP